MSDETKIDIIIATTGDPSGAETVREAIEELKAEAVAASTAFPGSVTGDDAAADPMAERTSDGSSPAGDRGRRHSDEDATGSSPPSDPSQSIAGTFDRAATRQFAAADRFERAAEQQAAAAEKITAAAARIATNSAQVLASFSTLLGVVEAQAGTISDLSGRVKTLESERYNN